MIEFFNTSWRDSLEQVKLLLHQGIFAPETGIQAIMVAVAVGLAFILTRIIWQLALSRLRQHWGEDSIWFSLSEKGAGLIPPLAAALVLEAMLLAFGQKLANCHVLWVSAKLAWAWLLVRLCTAFIVKGLVSRLMVLIIYGLVVLDILGLLAPLTEFLNGFGLQMGDFRLSLLSILKGALVAAFLLLFINFISSSLERYLPKSTKISPRVQILLIKTIKLVLYVLTVIVALDSLGLDFYLVSVFSGAFGLGLGFGLQKVISNLFSGFVILLDKSIRPGDVIETEGLFGWIESLHGRFARLVTRDGKSYLIPNEHFISNKVVNWSFGEPDVRIKVPVGISYDSDIHFAMALMLAAAKKNPRVLGYPQSVVRLMSFGDSAINLELRFWIKDPQNGVANVCSSIQIDIWDSFQANGITFPFPQSDVHVQTPTELKVVVRHRDEAREAGPPAAAGGGSGESPAPGQPGGDPPPRRSDPDSPGGE